MIYAELAAVALITDYIVGASGFTQSWRRLLAHALGLKEHQLRPLPPFDCATCASWWACIVYALATHAFSLWTLLFAAVLSLLAVPTTDMLLLLREGLSAVLRKLFNKL
jgi:hypothetical protein